MRSSGGAATLGDTPGRLIALHIDWPSLRRIDVDRLCRGLPAERVARVQRFRREEDQYRGALAGHLIRALFRAAFPAEAVPHLTEDALRRPCFAKRPAFDFNLSHSGDWVVGIAGRPRVGVDVERIEARRPLLDGVLSDRELEVLAGCPANRRTRLFTELWTLKEAHAKASGRGLQIDFRSLCFARHLEGPVPGAYALYRLDEAHACATCRDPAETLPAAQIRDAAEFAREAAA